ncbi:MAG: dependent protein, partial [Thermodesulfobacteriota bacterium]|nr:dependent protein [Thermodesulfobacteriota bacterium]
MKHRINEIYDRIRKAASSCNREAGSIRLVAVTKTVSAEIIREAAAYGISIIGESYIKEAREKYDLLSGIPVSWHFIGHLQTNKAKYAVKIFDLIHSVDSVRLAEELDVQAKKINKVQNILIQVNIGKEKTKSGIGEEEAPDLINELTRFKNILVKGLMVIPPYYDDPERVRPYFSALRKLRDSIVSSPHSRFVKNISLEELSMGMSGDFETAIEEG